MRPDRGPRLPAIVRALGAVSFLNDLASEMVYPLLPQLVTRTLGGGALALGALDGVADAVSSVVKLWAGWLTDRQGWRRPLIVGGYLIAAVTRPVTGLAGAAWQVVGLRAADRVGKGARNPPRDTVIADAAPPAIRGRAFGFHRAMDHAGAMIGPLIASGLMAFAAVSVKSVILLSAVPGVLAVLVAVLALRRHEQATTPAREEPTAPEATPVRTPSGPLLVTLVFLFAGLRMPEALFLLRVQDLGVGPAVIPVLWAGLHVVRSTASYPGGWLSDRMGPTRIMLIGWILYGAVAAGLASAQSGWSAGALLLALGLVSSCTEAPERALIAAWGGRAARGRRFGLYHAGVGLAALPGGLLLGALYQRAGGAVAFAASAGLVAALATVGMARELTARR